MKTFMSSKFVISVAIKKNKFFCGRKRPTEEQVKKYKRKRCQWVNDDKSVYIREDLTYKTICQTNLDVIEADEFRKNLDFKNYQSIRIEREMIVKVMKIFAKENMVRQYQIPGLSHRVDLCFVAHILVIEVDEDGHPYYENDEIRQKFIENIGFTFIRINPNPDEGFDSDSEIAKIYNFIN